MISTDCAQRVNTLAQAMAWYDKAQVYVKYKQGGKWSRAQMQHLKEALASRQNGIEVTSDFRKEDEFTKAIHSYEQLLKVYKPPKIAVVLKELKKKSTKLETRHEKMTDKHSKFLKLIKDCLHPVNYKGKPIKLYVDKIPSPSVVDSHGNVTFHQKQIVELRRTARKKGFLVAVLPLLRMLSEVYASFPEKDNAGHKTGRMMIDPNTRYHGVMYMLECLADYCQRPDAPKTLVRRKPKEKV